MVFAWGLVCVVLLLLLLLKAVSIVGAIRWLGRHGLQYVEHVPPGGFASDSDCWKAFHDNRGGFFPFGVKDYKLRRRLLRPGDPKGGARHPLSPICLFQNVLYRFHRLAAISGAAAVVTAFFFAQTPLVHIAYATTIVILLMTLLLSVEAIHAYSVMGDYAQSFHMFSRDAQRRADQSARLLNLRVLANLVATTAFAGTCAAYVALAGYGGFAGDAIAEAAKWVYPSSERAAQVWNCFYYTVTTLSTVGYGDIVPKNIAGQLVAVLLEFQAFAMVAFVLTSFFSAKER